MIKLKSEGQEKSEDFTIEFHKPLKGEKLALNDFSMNVSWDNINEKYNNHKFKLSYNGDSEIIFSNGLYTIEDFNYYMIKLFGKDSPIKFGLVGARDRFTIKLKPNVKVNFSEGQFYKIIGFENKIYENNTLEDLEIEGKNVADISRGNDIIYIHCNIVKGQMINQNYSEVIYSFTNTNRPRTLISKNFDNLLFFPVKHDSIDRIRMRITNQNGDLIEMNNGYVEYNFVLDNQSEDYSKKLYDLLSSKFLS